MRRVKALIGICAAIAIAGTSQALAQGRDTVSVGVQGSTAGFGPEIAYSVSPSFTLRGVGNFLSYDHDATLAGIDYGIDLDFASAGGFLDYHPLRNGFHLSVGALYNGNEADLSASAPPGTSIGGSPPLPSTAELVGNVSVDEFSPYVGLGYDSTFTSRSNWTFTVRAGVMYQANPSVVLGQTSGPTIPPGFLDAEAAAIEDDLRLLEFFPVVSVGMNYRF